MMPSKEATIKQDLKGMAIRRKAIETKAVNPRSGLVQHIFC